MKHQVAERLRACAQEAGRLLSVASSLGQVMIVTLSRDSWVATSSRHFCPELQELDISFIVIYRVAKLYSIWR